MTTGTTVTDLTTLGPYGRVGYYYSRTWSGTDETSSYPRNVVTQVTRYRYIPKPREWPRTKGLSLTAKPPIVYEKVPYTVLKRVWNRPPKRGRRSEHPYSMSASSYFDDVGQWSDNYGATWYNSTFVNSYGGSSFTSNWSANDDLALLGKLRERVAGSSFNAAVSLAEGHQSLRLIADSAVKLAKSLKYVQQGRYDKAWSAVAGSSMNTRKRNSATTLLEVQYGWRPLLNDVYEAAQFLAHLHSVPLQHVITVTRKVNGVVKSGSPTEVGLKGYGFESVRIKAILKEVDVIALSGMMDPMSIAWEKMPYSFVADWFIPIGSYLSARGLSQALTGTFVTSRYTKWKVHSAYKIPVTGIYAGKNLMRGFGYRREVAILTRTISTTLSVPRPEVKPLAKALSWQHCTNAVALLVNRFGSKDSRNLV